MSEYTHLYSRRRLEDICNGEGLADYGKRKTDWGRDIAEAALAAGDKRGRWGRVGRKNWRLWWRNTARGVNPVRLEVRDEAAAKAAVQLAVDTFGRLDVLVNNAGYGQFAPFEQMSAGRLPGGRGHLLFTAWCTQTRAAVPVMRKQRSGRIFQVSSVGGRLAVPGNTPYHAAKWAVGGFSDAPGHWKSRRFGVQICTLEPGGIRTNWARRAGQNAPGTCCRTTRPRLVLILKMLRGLEGRSEGDPRKIADVIVQLANRDEVPVRLILGVDAENRVQQAEAVRAAAEADKWRHLTVFKRFFEDGRFDRRLYMAKSGINS